MSLNIKQQNPVVDTQTSEFLFNVRLDSNFLNANYQNKLDFAVKMFKLFIENSKVDMDVLKLAVSNRNYETIRSIAHKTKNNFKWVGLTYLNELFNKLETAAKNESSEVFEIYEVVAERFEAGFNLVVVEHQRMQRFISVK